MSSVVVIAGGTGGHINAAISIGESLKKSFDVSYITGKRELDYKLFEKHNAYHANACALRGKSLIQTSKNLVINILLTIKFFFKFIRKRPSFMFGAGGYVCGPPLLAGWFLRIPIFILEQNAIAGYTNKILSKIATAVFTNFNETEGFSSYSKIVNIGNPIRSNIKWEENVLKNGELNILVFGGSLGASQINTLVNSIINEDFEYKVNIKHQTGNHNVKIEAVRNNTYISYKYIDNMENAYKWANLIISRAGASTLSELRVIQKPCILIPYPQATDNHQVKNARLFKDEAAFHVSILDSSKEDNELKKQLKKELNNIIENKLFISKFVECKNATMLLKREIKKYVWFQ